MPTAEVYHGRKEAQRCPQCAEPRSPQAETVFCRDCLDLQRLYQQVYRDRQRAQRGGLTGARRTHGIR